MKLLGVNRSLYRQHTMALCMDKLWAFKQKGHVLMYKASCGLLSVNSTSQKDRLGSNN